MNIVTGKYLKRNKIKLIYNQNISGGFIRILALLLKMF